VKIPLILCYSATVSAAEVMYHRVKRPFTFLKNSYKLFNPSKQTLTFVELVLEIPGIPVYNYLCSR
jgi:hypothetical protein